MRPDELLRVLLFVAAVTAVFVGAAAILAGSLLRRLRGGAAAPPGRARLRLHRAILTLAGVGLLCVAYGRLVEPYWPSITRVRLTSPKLAGLERPIRIVLISDLHSDPRPRLEGKLPALVAAERPDAILFAGDAINSPGGLPVFRDCLARLAAIAPTFAVKGNWDVWYFPHLERFGGTGAREIDGEAVRLEGGGAPVWIAGVAVGGEARLDRALAPIPAEGYAILLHHYPDLIPEAAARKVDLYLAGHTHGGQVALPFYGALITLSRFGKKYESGLYRERETWMYVNRGIGMEGGVAPRVRFCARPEVTVLDLSPPVWSPPGAGMMRVSRRAAGTAGRVLRGAARGSAR